MWLFCLVPWHCVAVLCLWYVAVFKFSFLRCAGSSSAFVVVLWLSVLLFFFLKKDIVIVYLLFVNLVVNCR